MKQNWIFHLVFLFTIHIVVGSQYHEYAIVEASNSTYSHNFCFVYYPGFRKLPESPDDSSHYKLIDLSPATACNDTIAENVTDKIVLVADGGCRDIDKAYKLQGLGALGVIISTNGTKYDSLLKIHDISTKDVDIIVGIIADSNRALLSDIENYIDVRLYSAPSSKIDFSLIMIWILAVFTVVVGSYWSGVERFKIYEESSISYEEVTNTEQTDSSADDDARTSEKNSAANNKRYRTLNVSIRVVILLVLCACTTLLLLYFFFTYVVKVLIVIFLIFLAISMANLLQFFLHKIPALRKSFRYKKFSISVGELISIIPAAVPAIWWYIVRKGSYAWVLQDFMGMCFIIVALREFRMPSLRIVTYLLVLLFIYDIFFVFITPFFTKSRPVSLFQTGESIMVSVATGVDGEELPIALKVPRFDPGTLGFCFHLYSLLGFGDMIAPGLLLSYCHGYDLENGRRRLYFVISCVFYGLGLITAFIALCLMETAQPALLYLVPITLIPIIVVSWRRKELALLWKGTDSPAPKCDEEGTGDVNDDNAQVLHGNDGNVSAT